MYIKPIQTINKFTSWDQFDYKNPFKIFKIPKMGYKIIGKNWNFLFSKFQNKSTKMQINTNQYKPWTYKCIQLTFRWKVFLSALVCHGRPGP